MRPSSEPALSFQWAAPWHVPDVVRTSWPPLARAGTALVSRTAELRAMAGAMTRVVVRTMSMVTPGFVGWCPELCRRARAVGHWTWVLRHLHGSREGLRP